MLYRVRLHDETMGCDVMEIVRGDIFIADLNPVQGSEQGGVRPVVIVQNDVGNRYSPTTIVCPITSVVTKKPLPTHVTLKPLDCGLRQTSVVLAEHGVSCFFINKEKYFLVVTIDIFGSICNCVFVRLF